MDYSISWINSGVVIVFDETLTFEMVKDIAGKLVGNEHFDSLLFQVWDFRNVTDVKISKHEALPSASLAKASSVWSRKQMIAILANINPNIETFFNTFNQVMHMTEWKCGLFDDKLTLIKWLMSGLGDDLLDKNPALLNDFRFIYNE